MGKDIRKGTVAQLWTNVEVAGRGIWTYAHFELNDVPVRLRLDPTSSRYNSPVPTPFAEGEMIVVSGEMEKDTFHVQMTFLPERNQLIAPSTTLLAIVCGILCVPSILGGLTCLHWAAKMHADLVIWLIGLILNALGLYFLWLPFDQKATEKLLKAAARASD